LYTKNLQRRIERQKTKKRDSLFFENQREGKKKKNIICWENLATPLQ